MKICPLRVFYLCDLQEWTLLASQAVLPAKPRTPHNHVSKHGKHYVRRCRQPANTFVEARGTRARKQSGEKPQLWLAINLLNGGGWKWRHETLRWSWFAVLRLLGIPRFTLWYLWVLLQALQVKSKLDRWLHLIHSLLVHHACKLLQWYEVHQAKTGGWKPSSPERKPVTLCDFFCCKGGW